MKKLDFLCSNLIAHRGLHNDKYPENSIGAFKRAIRKNYIIELDVHLLKDDTVVVFHDDNLYRMCGKRKKIKDYTYPELKKLKLLDTNYTIPTLENVLKLIDGKVPIIVELKYDLKVGLLEEKVCELLDDYNGDFCVKSFSPLSIMWFKKNRPNYIRGLLISNRTKKLREKLMHSFIPFWMCKPDFISCNYLLYKKRIIQKFMRKHPVIAWTVRSENTYNKYKDKFSNMIVEKFL